jgi:hypothetical protein
MAPVAFASIHLTRRAPRGRPENGSSTPPIVHPGRGRQTGLIAVVAALAAVVTSLAFVFAFDDDGTSRDPGRVEGHQRSRDRHRPAQGAARAGTSADLIRFLLGAIRAPSVPQTRQSSVEQRGAFSPYSCPAGGRETLPFAYGGDRPGEGRQAGRILHAQAREVRRVAPPPTARVTVRPCAGGHSRGHADR